MGISLFSMSTTQLEACFRYMDPNSSKEKNQDWMPQNTCCTPTYLLSLLIIIIIIMIMWLVGAAYYSIMAFCNILNMNAIIMHYGRGCPRSMAQWIQAILLVESFKIGPKVFRRESKTKKIGRLRLNIHDNNFGGKINWFRPKNSAKRRALNLENQQWD